MRRRSYFDGTKHRRARVSLNVTELEFARLLVVCRKLGATPARYVRDAAMGAVNDDAENLNLEREAMLIWAEARSR